MYWESGWLIVGNEQQGNLKAEYGKATLKNLSQQLTLEFGKGFDERNLNNMRAFYRSFPIWNAVRSELSWTHYRIISRVKDENLRSQYVGYAIEGNWDTRTLQRNINTKYLGRILDTEKDAKAVPHSHVKEPYILEFLGLQNETALSEKQLKISRATMVKKISVLKFFTPIWSKE